MFRQLTDREKSEFKQWARANYVPQTEISQLWHPVIQAECRRMCEENKFQSGERLGGDNEKQNLKTK